MVVSGNLFEKAGLASISGSATPDRSDEGTVSRRSSGSCRTTPSRARQIVTYVAGKLKAKNVVVIDSQDDYSLPLASAISRGLRARNVSVSRESVSADDTDFSSVVANVGSNVNVVVFATQVASAANTLSNQLREQGKKAIVFGTDGAYSPSQYKPRKRLRVSVRTRSSISTPALGRSSASTTGTRRTRSSARSARRRTWLASWQRPRSRKPAPTASATRAEVTRETSADEHPLDLRRQAPVRLRRETSLPTASSSSTGSRTGSTARSARSIMHRSERPTRRAGRSSSTSRRVR